MDEYSTNDEAKRIMGLRQTEGVIPFDQPCEVGYWCPVCKVPAIVDGEYDQRLHWSEYNGFLWCEVCDKDYPSPLCVPLDGEKFRTWHKVGIDDAIEVFLNVVDGAIQDYAEGKT